MPITFNFLKSTVNSSAGTGNRTVTDTFTASGNTPKLLSRYLSRIPIYAMVENPRILARVALYRGVQPVLFRPEQREYEAMNRQAVGWLESQHIIGPGDRVILAKGDLVEDRQPGGTNTMKIIQL